MSIPTENRIINHESEIFRLYEDRVYIGTKGTLSSFLSTPQTFQTIDYWIKDTEFIKILPDLGCMSVAEYDQFQREMYYWDRYTKVLQQILFYLGFKFIITDKGAAIKEHNFCDTHFQYLLNDQNYSIFIGLLCKVISSIGNFNSLIYARDSLLDYLFCSVRDKKGVAKYMTDPIRWFVQTFLNLCSPQCKDYYMNTLYTINPGMFK